MSEARASAARRGFILILSSPSGAGKTSISRSVLGKEANIGLSISVTTRERRASEVDGEHYHFISTRRFEAMRDAGELLEWAQVHGNYYGTPLEPVQRAIEAGRDMLFDIDWQGAQQVAKKLRADTVSVFVLPPSAQELRARLERRAEDSAEVIQRRLENASAEIEHWGEYDYILVNRDLDRSVAQVLSIVEAERLRRTRQATMPGFVADLVSGLKGS